MRYTSVLLLLVLSFMSCDIVNVNNGPEDSSGITETEPCKWCDFSFPLEVGNTWRYRFERNEDEYPFDGKVEKSHRGIWTYTIISESAQNSWQCVRETEESIFLLDGSGSVTKALFTDSFSITILDSQILSDDIIFNDAGPAAVFGGVDTLAVSIDGSIFSIRKTLWLESHSYTTVYSLPLVGILQKRTISGTLTLIDMGANDLEYYLESFNGVPYDGKTIYETVYPPPTDNPDSSNSETGGDSMLDQLNGR